MNELNIKSRIKQTNEPKERNKQMYNNSNSKNQPCTLYVCAFVFLYTQSGCCNVCVCIYFQMYKYYVFQSKAKQSNEKIFSFTHLLLHIREWMSVCIFIYTCVYMNSNLNAITYTQTHAHTLAYLNIHMFIAVHTSY